ncbi:MAG: adenylate kinase [Clostridia bacterium]|nr:adenylate kinase [Clostridia bacterium]
MKIVLLGPPGSGKGTQAQLICEKYHLPHISTGDMFRKNISNNTELGKKANEFISKGSLVPDSLTISIVKDRLSEEDCKKGFVLDGFPRNLFQTQELNKIVQIDKAIMINISDEEIIKRLSGRRMCKKCGNPTHIDWLKNGLCEKCGGEVFVREDDSPDIVKARLEKQKLPLEVLDFYKSKNIFEEVECAQTKEEVFENIEKILKKIK